jgi:FkbM family methyltransferase
MKPLRKLDRYFKKLIPTRYPRIVTLRDFEPSGVRFEIANDTESGRVIEHGFETEYTQRMLDFLEPEDVLFDVGSCVGLVAIHAAKRCSKVVAFEPDPGFNARLKLNLSMNPGISIDVLEVALGDRDQTMILYTDGIAGNSPSLRPGWKGRDKIEVPVRTLDSLLAEGLPRPTVIKLDVEGAETMVLKGGVNLLTSSHAPRSIYLEVHHSFLPDFGSSSEEVMALLRSWGYTEIRYSADRHEQRHLIVDRSAQPS